MGPHETEKLTWGQEQCKQEKVAAYRMSKDLTNYTSDRENKELKKPDIKILVIQLKNGYRSKHN